MTVGYVEKGGCAEEKKNEAIYNLAGAGLRLWLQGLREGQP